MSEEKKGSEIKPSSQPIPSSVATVKEPKVGDIVIIRPSEEQIKQRMGFGYNGAEKLACIVTSNRGGLVINGHVFLDGLDSKFQSAIPHKTSAQPDLMSWDWPE